MKRKTHIVGAIAAAMLSTATLAQEQVAEDRYLNSRKARGQTQVDSYDKANRALTGDEFLLMSMSRSVPYTVLRPAVEKTQTKLTAVYLCGPATMVMAASLDGVPDPWQRLTDQKDPSGVAANIRAAEEAFDKMSQRVPNMAFPAMEYCGVEVQGSAAATRALRETLAPYIFMSEITTRKRRVSAVNVIKR